MIFTVIDRNGRIVFSTEHEQCIPPVKQLAEMHKLGYRFKRDGKAWNPNKGGSK